MGIISVWLLLPKVRFISIWQKRKSPLGWTTYQHSFQELCDSFIWIVVILWMDANKSIEPRNSIIAHTAVSSDSNGEWIYDVAETRCAFFFSLRGKKGGGTLSTCVVIHLIVVTWLILPVVICLSQRLSHACLSINIFIQWNCVQLIISVIIYLMVPYYMDTRSNSRANTCVKSRLLGRDVFIRLKTNAGNCSFGDS
jgi:hypothetical protein